MNNIENVVFIADILHCHRCGVVCGELFGCDDLCGDCFDLKEGEE